MSRTHIWWIRRDIRLEDNLALEAALKDADALIPLFVIEPDLMDSAAPKRRAFLLDALADLDRQLKQLGSQLVIRQGPALSALQKLHTELGNPVIFAHEDFSHFARARDQAVQNQLGLNLLPGVVLHHPDHVLKDNGDPYTVYTPYKNKWYDEPLPTPADILPAPKRMPPLPDKIDSIALPSAKAVPGFPSTTAEAQQRLSAFLENGIHHYKSQRDLLAMDGTSRLSPYFRFGLVSIKQAFAQSQVAFMKAKGDGERAEIRTWMNELVWREFYTAILYHFPHVMDGPFRQDYRDIPWRDAPEDLQAWQKGQTGFPIVDACMRQLSATGWMHNRGRMIAASFLTKDLLINWQAGETWFMGNLVDGDPAANNGGWQWTAGTGTDAAPYFRIFNPILQGKKYDTEGKYIVRWVPELAKLPQALRHEPWTISAEQSNKYAFELGRDYPHPIVDHFFARDRALEAYRTSREQY
ncbi:MAG: cryptochrome/photolyase family protein [Anaerolineales bacterium]